MSKERERKVGEIESRWEELIDIVKERLGGLVRGWRRRVATHLTIPVSRLDGWEKGLRPILDSDLALLREMPNVETASEPDDEPEDATEDPELTALTKEYVRRARREGGSLSVARDDARKEWERRKERLRPAPGSNDYFLRLEADAKDAASDEAEKRLGHNAAQMALLGRAAVLTRALLNDPERFVEFKARPEAKIKGDTASMSNRRFTRLLHTAIPPLS